MQHAELDNSDDFDPCIGAAKIAQKCFNGQVSTRQVYRLHEAGGWPIFEFRGKLAARTASIRVQPRASVLLSKWSNLRAYRVS